LRVPPSTRGVRTAKKPQHKSVEAFL
jgi:hypothetical protein